MVEPFFTDADRAYLRANYFELEELCAERPERPAEVRDLIDRGVMPRPSYTVDGREMFPADYFQLCHDAGGVEGLREHFETRYRAAAKSHPELATPAAIERAWQAYLDGIWGQCLNHVTPEVMVRKRALVDSLCKLVALPRPRSAEWRQRLRAEVDELDRIERDFAPDYDRAEDWNDRPPTRDLLIETARRRFPEVFAQKRDSASVAASANGRDQTPSGSDPVKAGA
jgi:hypothetical protein